MSLPDWQISTVIRQLNVHGEPSSQNYKMFCDLLKNPQAYDTIIALHQFLEIYGHADSFRRPGEAPLTVGHVFNRDPNSWKLLQLGHHLQGHLKISLATAGDLLRRIRLAKEARSVIPSEPQVVRANLVSMPLAQALDVVGSGLTQNVSSHRPGATTWNFRLKPMQRPNEPKMHFLAAANYKWAPDAYGFDGMNFGFVEAECTVEPEPEPDAPVPQADFFQESKKNRLRLTCAFSDELAWAMRESRILVHSTWQDIAGLLDRFGLLAKTVEQGRLIDNGVLPGRGFLDYTAETQLWPPDPPTWWPPLLMPLMQAPS